MGNMNTVARLINLPGPVSVTETCVAQPVGSGNLYGIPTSTTAIRAALEVPPDIAGGVFDGFPFRIRYAAAAVCTGASTFTVNTYLALASPNNTNLTTLTSDAKITTHANTMASASGTCFGSAIGQWNSVAGSLAFYYGEGGNNVVTTPVVLTSSLKVAETSPLTATAVTTAGLMIFYITFTSSSAANTTSTKLIEFVIERV